MLLKRSCSPFKSSHFRHLSCQDLIVLTSKMDLHRNTQEDWKYGGFREEFKRWPPWHERAALSPRTLLPARLAVPTAFSAVVAGTCWEKCSGKDDSLLNEADWQVAHRNQAYSLSWRLERQHRAGKSLQIRSTQYAFVHVCVYRNM